MDNGTERTMTAMRAIRAKCLDCSGDSRMEVHQCPVKDCPLYKFRYGKNPNSKPREYSDEQKEAMRVRLAKARENKNVQ